ncbi:MAG: RNA polymerase sporulation sigma factor SigK [Clostridia bacterium]|nr:RNA polymerase sporulation sigma factor SigK [Clostridia bacterium]MDD4386444.1 RNA polymerase sporulation sigma factor SigK [Clostridia bacterium]
MFFSFFGNILSYIFCLFGYIKSENLYPEPLSKTEEEYYLKKYFEGDREAKNKLIEHNLRLVVHIAKKYTNKEQDIEEFTSIGTIGLIKAINSFKEEKGFKISTYASKCIDNEILMYIRSTKKNQAEISMNSIIGTDKDGNDMELLDTLVIAEKDPIDTIYNKVITDQMIEYINTKLSKRERDIMTMRYGLDKKIPKTQQEVADRLGISRSYVSRIETKVQKSLGKILLQEE